MSNRSLIEKLKKKTAVIGIVGLGYTGLPLSLRFSEVGYRVIGFDIDQSKVDSLRHGRSYIQHISSKAIARAINEGFEPTKDFARSGEADAIIICVPTPLNEFHDPDISFIVNAMDSLAPYLRTGQIVSLESTSYPGTTDEALRPCIESKGLRVGEDVFLVFSPEREDPGNPDFTTKDMPKVCGGTTPACLEAGMELYRQVIDQVVPVSSTRAAEMTKLLENIHRAVNIALVNEMKMIADGMGLDIHEIIRAAATKPFGFVPYYPGPGIGGHCIPVNPFYLTWKAKEYGLDTRLIELAVEVNNGMPAWVIGKIRQAMKERCTSINESNFLILGVAYKKNIDDTRESPSLRLIDLLQQEGGSVDYCDPHVPVLPKTRKRQGPVRNVTLSAEMISSYDCVVIATDHVIFDYQLIKQNAKLIIDTRGVSGTFG